MHPSKLATTKSKIGERTKLARQYPWYYFFLTNLGDATVTCSHVKRVLLHGTCVCIGANGQGADGGVDRGAQRCARFNREAVRDTQWDETNVSGGRGRCQGATLTRGGGVWDRPARGQGGGDESPKDGGGSKRRLRNAGGNTLSRRGGRGVGRQDRVIWPAQTLMQTKEVSFFCTKPYSSLNVTKLLFFIYFCVAK